MPELTQPTQPYHSLQPLLFAAALCVPSAPAVRARGPDSQTSDDELLERFAAGQQGAADELLRRHQADAFRVACRILRNHADAQDAVQEGFLNAWRHRDQFKGDASFRTWLLRVVTRAALNLCRQKGKFFARERGSGAAEVAYARAQQRKQNNLPLDDLAEQELPEAIERILAQATLRQREVYALWQKEKPTAEIAAELGVSMPTVRRDWRKLLSILRAQLSTRGWSAP